jgi:two-component system, LuxR family, sensor kinase FixL
MSSAIAQTTAETARASRARLLKGLIWGFCLLLIIGIWWFVVAQIAFERQVAIGDAIRQNVNRTIAFEQYIRRTLESADMATRYVAERYARGTAGAEFAGTRERPASMRGGIARGGTFLGVSVVDRNGDIVATSAPPELGRLPNVADHPAFRAHVERDSGRLFVSQPRRSPILGQPVLWLSRRLNNPDGSFAGVVAINISPSQFTAFYRDAQINPKDVMAVIGLDGFVRARRIGQVTSAGEDARGGRAVAAQARQPSGTYVGPSRRDGLVRYTSHRRLHDYPLFVTYGVLESEVLAAPRHRARIFIGAAALLSSALVGFALVLTVLLNRGERREAEMTRANLRLQEAQRIGQIGDWHYDLRSGETIWSPQLLAMYEREALGSPTFDEFRSYLDEEGRAAIDRAHAEAVRTGEAQEVEYAVRLPSGSESYHWSAVIPALDSSGKVVGLHGADQNISARKLLDLLQTHVAHLSRVEAMNAMAATLAHELNQPLTSASNYLVGSRRRLKAEGGAALDEAAEGMAAAEQQVHLAAEIIRRVREMVSNRPRTVVPVSLGRIVDDAVALIAMASAGANLDVKKRIAVEARMVKGDRIQLQQVMINLIRNAIDATEGHPSPEIVVSSRRDEKGVVLVSVSDNGIGFSQPDVERFSPFASTKGSGLGLGLSISRTIIESHGGRIWTEDLDGRGARVCFTLPSARRQPGPAAAAEEEAAA